MSRLEMQHHSYPGYHAAALSPDALGRLSRVAEVMIPASAGFPDAGALVPRFVGERVDPAGRDMLEELLAGIDDTSAAGVTDWLQRLEGGDATSFATLRHWVYHGYYASGSVADALRQAGSDYHGAPQPFGYRIDREAPVPQTPRGSYQETEEVRSVLD